MNLFVMGVVILCTWYQMHLKYFTSTKFETILYFSLVASKIISKIIFELHFAIIVNIMYKVEIQNQGMVHRYITF